MSGKNLENTEILNTEDVEFVNTQDEIIERETKITLSHPYIFEGKSYDKIDLEGLENLSARDMIKINKRLARKGNVDFMPETNLEYALELSAAATELPIEFFESLSIKDAVRIKTAIMGFMWSSE